MIITIDGPSASGKSSTARTLAKELGFYYLNTGLMYRAMAWLVENKNLDLSTIQTVPFDYIFKDGASRILFEGQDITDQLLDSKVGQAASLLSQDKDMHDVLVKYQQSFGDKENIVVEGRDAGSVLFPNADLKVYLTASDEVRAKRVLGDAARHSSGKSLEQVIAEIKQRDKQDMEREVCPLVIPEGAVIIDNSNLSLQETVEKIKSYI